jgi:hypothetical protein
MLEVVNCASGGDYVPRSYAGKAAVLVNKKLPKVVGAGTGKAIWRHGIWGGGEDHDDLFRRSPIPRASCEGAR